MDYGMIHFANRVVRLIYLAISRGKNRWKGGAPISSMHPINWRIGGEKILYLFVVPVLSKESEVMRYGYIPGYDDVHGIDRGDRRSGRYDHGVFRQ